mmetsp:Transcript_40137/g.78684  ORF Transcript_40137/g.78684 Transcript_40137/m.78684 type:complete len:96 (+) Transcript_40137:829-1116(+)
MSRRCFGPSRLAAQYSVAAKPLVVEMRDGWVALGPPGMMVHVVPVRERGWWWARLKNKVQTQQETLRARPVGALEGCSRGGHRNDDDGRRHEVLD